MANCSTGRRSTPPPWRRASPSSTSGAPGARRVVSRHRNSGRLRRCRRIRRRVPRCGRQGQRDLAQASVGTVGVEYRSIFGPRGRWPWPSARSPRTPLPGTHAVSRQHPRRYGGLGGAGRDPRAPLLSGPRRPVPPRRARRPPGPHVLGTGATTRADGLADPWALLIVLGVLLVTGAWNSIMVWLRSWLASTGFGTRAFGPATSDDVHEGGGPYCYPSSTDDRPGARVVAPQSRR